MRIRTKSTPSLTAAMIATLAILIAAMGCGPSEHSGSGQEEITHPGTDMGQEEHYSEQNYSGDHTLEDRLIDVIGQGDVETLRRRLEEGADPNEMDPTGSGTPLYVAISMQNPEMVQMLLEAGADPNAPGPLGNSPLVHAAEMGNPEIQAAISAAGGAGATAPGNESEALHDAVKTGNTQIIREMLRAGADPNTHVPGPGYVDANGDGVRDLWTVPVLYEAIKIERLSSAKALLDGGADPNARGFVYLLDGQPDPENNMAAIFGITEDPSVESGPFGDAPLHEAVSNENAEMVQALLDAGADTDPVSRFGKTPLMLAVADENITIVRILIEAGANPDAENNQGKTALQTLERSSNKELKALLREAGQ